MRISPRVLAAFIAVASLKGDQKKLTMDQRVELLRGLTSEYANVKVASAALEKASGIQLRRHLR